MNIAAILDIYGFEVFSFNTFEQLCINYANERLQKFFVNNYIVEHIKEIESEGFKVETIDVTEYSARVSLLDGTLSVFSILNEECLLKRFNSDSFVNSRITENLKNHTYFGVSAKNSDSEFLIRHYAGDVSYNSKDMVAKNRDKVPKDIVKFLLENCRFEFLKDIINKDKIEHETSSTLLKKFKVIFLFILLFFIINT